MGEQTIKTLYKEYPDLAPPFTILSGYRGSIAHGMYVPQSDPNSIDDKDVMAVTIPDLSCYFGLESYGSRGTKEIHRDPWDIVIYELRKYVGLLCKGNPNVIALLWLHPTHYIERTDTGDMLLRHRELFITRELYHSFIGYAYSQLHRMTHFKFEGYMGQKRKTLVEKYGYDTKNAAHLIRLLRMGIECMKEGVLHVQRPDASQLLEIKLGEWTLEQVQEEAQRLFRRVEDAYDSSSLPTQVDRDKVNELCEEMIRQRWRLY